MNLPMDSSAPAMNPLAANSIGTSLRFNCYIFTHSDPNILPMIYAKIVKLKLQVAANFIRNLIDYVSQNDSQDARKMVKTQFRIAFLIAQGKPNSNWILINCVLEARVLSSKVKNIP
jgi:hypothetical protein